MGGGFKHSREGRRRGKSPRVASWRGKAAERKITKVTYQVREAGARRFPSPDSEGESSLSMGLRHKGNSRGKGLPQAALNSLALQVCAVSLSQAPELGGTNDSYSHSQGRTVLCVWRGVLPSRPWIEFGLSWGYSWGYRVGILRKARETGEENMSSLLLPLTTNQLGVASRTASESWQ